MCPRYDVTPDPEVAELLDVDREFRRSGRALLQAARDGRRYTALHSPSARAERLGRTRDWVIIDLALPGPNMHWTVVTEYRGVLRGKRVVRGREIECFRHYHRTRRNRSAA